MSCPQWYKNHGLLVIYNSEPASTLFFKKMYIKVMEIERMQKIEKIKICTEF